MEAIEQNTTIGIDCETETGYFVIVRCNVCGYANSYPIETACWNYADASEAMRYAIECGRTLVQDFAFDCEC